jgi:hypothetical protein
MSQVRFWHHGGDKLAYCPDSVVAKLRDQLGDLAEVTGLGETVDFGVTRLGSRSWTLLWLVMPTCGYTAPRD